MTIKPCVRCAAANPETALDQALLAFAGSPLAEQLLLVDFTLREYWRDGTPETPLLALYHLRRQESAIRIDVSVLPAESADALAQYSSSQSPSSQSRSAQDIGAWLDRHRVCRLSLERPLPLLPVAIPKPWGQEIWYTGIERRGVAAVGTEALSLPLPWLLAAAPRRLRGAAEHELILLKILDPLPDEVYGDLYFELHRQKQEVYVVTDVNREAWPDGTGAIRFGFNAELRAGHDDDAQFLRAYLAAVGEYRQIRSRIDELLDGRRASEGVGLSDPVSSATLRRWLAEIPRDLQDREREKREAMERFTGVLPLRVGDVVKVPCWVPHSLQHGVRTVEFQTPVYERLILSFAQKVLTQAGWDTEEAAAVLQLDPPEPQAWEVTAQGQGWIEERIVRFDDFEVRRITLEAGAQRWFDAPEAYALCMVIGGALRFDGIDMKLDQAVLVPRGWEGGSAVNRGQEPRRLLWAVPRAAEAS